MFILCYIIWHVITNEYALYHSHLQSKKTKKTKQESTSKNTAP